MFKILTVNIPLFDHWLLSLGHSVWPLTPSVYLTCCECKQLQYGNMGILSKCSSRDVLLIRESVDSLCRDGADAQYMQYLSKTEPYNFTTNTLKGYLSVQASSLSAYVISKTNFDKMQIIFKAITGSSGHAFWWERTVLHSVRRRRLMLVW